MKVSSLSIIALTLSSFLFPSGVADHTSTAHEGGWMEKWLSFDPGLFMWTIVTFLIVLFILKWKAWGPLMSALDKREEDIKNAVERALTASHLELFDQKGKMPLTPENLFKENTVTVIDIHTLSPARQRMMILYLLLVLQRYKFQERHDEPGVLVYLDESEYIFPKTPGSIEKDQVQRISEMIKEPVERGRKHKYGLVAITHSISRMNSTVVDLCNTKLIFGRTVSSGKTWFVNNIGKDRTKELAYLQQGQAIIDTRQTSIPINTTLHVPFVGKKEDYFGD